MLHLNVIYLIEVQNITLTFSPALAGDGAVLNVSWICK